MVKYLFQLKYLTPNLLPKTPWDFSLFHYSHLPESLPNSLKFIYHKLMKKQANLIDLILFFLVRKTLTHLDPTWVGRIGVLTQLH